MTWNEVHQLILKMDKELQSATSSKNIAIFGACFYGRVALDYLKSNGFNVLCFSDNDINKHGKKIEGINIVSPQQLKELHPDMVFITAHHFITQIKKQLGEMNIPNISFGAYHAAKHEKELLNVRNNLLSDCKSQIIYELFIKTLLSDKKQYCVEAMDDGLQYFTLPPFRNKSFCYVDAGAYVGDTIENFLFVNNGNFNHIYAFEPCVPKFQSMTTRMKRLVEEWNLNPEKISLLPAGLGKENKQSPLAFLNTDGTTFLFSNNEKETIVPVVTLDKFLNGEPATLIKADIEGMEMDMLIGATETIKKFKPHLAISIYHCPEDLYRIAEFIKSLVPEYKMAARLHAPWLVDLVLYCWIPEN